MGGVRQHQRRVGSDGIAHPVGLQPQLRDGVLHHIFEERRTRPLFAGGPEEVLLHVHDEPRALRDDVQILAHGFEAQRIHARQILQILTQAFDAGGDRQGLVADPVNGLQRRGRERLIGLGADDFRVGGFQFAEQLCISQGHRQLIRHRLQAGDVVSAERLFLDALHRQRADNRLAHDQGQRHLRASMWQIGVFEVDRLLAHIECDARLVLADSAADHGMPADAQFVPLGDHVLPGLAVTGAQHGPFASLVEQENAGVVEAIGVADDVHGVVEQHLQVEDGGHLPAHLGGGSEQAGAAFKTRQQTLILAVQAGVVNGDGQLIGHGLQAGDVVLAEGGLFRALHGERADERVADDERQRHLGARVGQMGILEVHRLLPHVQGNEGPALAGRPSDHRMPIYLELVPLGDHALAGFAVTGVQHGPAAGLIQEKYPRVVEAEGVTDEIYGSFEQALGIQNGSDTAGHLRSGVQEQGATFGKILVRLHFRPLLCPLLLKGYGPTPGAPLRVL
ncbi:MAG: hypothetical protein BWY25_01993 [Chloroflexi bacterium ADurb.Bin222]|nr:MAG: hypothetical protein BWY25_01993 [Chloroflexi bacterium ADurb.Bin222]